MSGDFGNLGRGADAAKHSLMMSLTGLFWTASAGFALFSFLWTAMWFSLNSAEVRETGWNYTKATAVSFFKPSSLLKMEVNGVKRTVSASTLLQVLETSPALHHQVTIAKATSAGFAAIAAVPSIIVTFVMSIFFAIIGKFMQQDEHLRGVKIIDSVDEFNAMIDRNIRGVHKVERGWVKRLRAFK